MQVQSPTDPQQNSPNRIPNYSGRESVPSYGASAGVGAGAGSSQNGVGLNPRNGFDSQASPFAQGFRLPPVAPPSNNGYYPGYYIQPPYNSNPVPLQYQQAMGPYSAYGYGPSNGFIPTYYNHVNPYAQSIPAYEPRSAANGASMLGQSAYTGQALQQQSQQPQQPQYSAAHFPSFYRGGIGQRLKPEDAKKPSK